MKKLFALASLMLLAVSTATSAQAQNKLHLYNWNNYLAAETVQRFEVACKCQLVQSYYGDNEEMLVAQMKGKYKYIGYQINHHLCPAYGHLVRDEMFDRQQKDWEHDETNFNNRKILNFDL